MTKVLESLDIGLKRIVINVFREVDSNMKHFIIELEPLQNNQMEI